jgi:hypothetical protein
MKKLRHLLLTVIILQMVIYGCDSTKPKDPSEPAFNAWLFSNSTRIDNTYLPLIPGTTHLYQTETEDGLETIVTEVLDTTRVVNGVECVVFRDRVFLDELLIEDTYDWFAQDDDGNVWYMGEEVVNYEYDDNDELIGTDSDGSWEAGMDVANIGSNAVAGILIKNYPSVGDSYQQEYYRGEAEDMAQVDAVGITVTLGDGTTYTNCLKTLEWNPLEEDSEEYKYYAPGVGLIKEEAVGGDEVVEIKGIFLTGEDRVPDFEAALFSNSTTIDNMYLPLLTGDVLTYQADTEDGVETIITEVLATTRLVNGVECVVFHDRVYLDEGDGDVLIEDTHDWFAQDDDGNVWYMGEEVINYEYDDDGNLTDTNNDGAWEAGEDGALPGIVMWADPTTGASYYQEYYVDEAEDMGLVVADGVEVELEDGTIYENCLQTLDWNPLEPETLEYKYYAPNVGLVMEEVVGGDEVVELID